MRALAQFLAPPKNAFEGEELLRSAVAAPALTTASPRPFVIFRSEKERLPAGLRFLVGVERRGRDHCGTAEADLAGRGEGVTMVTCDIFRAWRAD